ncbi:hypothetical protein RN001_002238 [Aquatica leii]|uniref:DUF4781 domain-containing protein n=1 Tax=Aquatica leii TaxID=1421715 RepID=A0AAN7Q8H4_9COLE|nr:hypothetical protein RN001_002238 [Aquatica leii]
MSASYLVCYKSKNIELDLPLDATIESFQEHLFRKTKLHPSLQHIAELSNIHNSALLISVCPEDNVLWLSSKDEINSDDSLYEGIKSVYIENAEENACLSFVQKFTLKYKQDHITFQCCSLKDAIQTFCLGPMQSRKLLALYLHNENDRFADVVCSGFVNGEMRNILEKSYNVLSWDLSTNANELLNALNEWLELQTLKQMILTNKSVFSIIYPFDESIILYNILHGDTVTLNDICTQLKNAQVSFENILNERNKLTEIERCMKKNNDIGSVEFQQMMFDRLGDRDYDSFEPDEHFYLKDKIAFAKFGPPQTENGYDENEKKSIEETYETIVKHNNKYAEWKNRIIVSFIYNCSEPLPDEKLKRSIKVSNYNPYTDINPIPIFVIQKCLNSQNSCRIFVDCDNRVYSSWEDYISNNKLQKCMMILPKNGRYHGNEYGNVQLEKHVSPSCGIQNTLFQSADIASSVAGITSGAIFLGAAIPAITVAPILLSVASVTGISVGLYSIFRSGMKIYDRVTHCESMSFKHSEARGAYLNIIAGSLGFVGAGATSAMSHLAADGIYIGEGARAAVNVLNIANTSVNAVAFANAAYEIYDIWSEGGTISTLSVIQLGSSILFFGNAVYNFKTANTIISEAQSNTLKHHQESLKSNRHRKTFNKLVKETIRQSNGDAQAGRAEVIATITKVSNVDEVMGILTRNNRLLNKENVRFAAENGEIKLNGVAVNLKQMGTMSKLQRTQFLIDLPPIPKHGVTNNGSWLATTTSVFNSVFTNELRLILPVTSLYSLTCVFVLFVWFIALFPYACVHFKLMHNFR